MAEAGTDEPPAPAFPFRILRYGVEAGSRPTLADSPRPS